MKCLMTQTGTGNHPGRRLLSWMCGCWSFLAARWGYLLFSHIVCDSVKDHAESTVTRQNKSLVVCAGEKKWDPVFGKAAKLSKDCTQELKLNEVTAKDAGTMVRRRSDARGELRPG